MTQTKRLSLGLAIALVAGNMIGSGIYLLPASIAAIGSSSMIGWGVALVGALVIAGVLSRLAVLLPSSEEGALDWVRDAFGAPVGFVNAALYWISCPISVMAIGLAVTGYAGAIFPPLTASPFATVTTTITLIWAMIGLNLIGPRVVARFEGWSLAIGLLPVLAVGLLGWLWFDPEVFVQAWNPSGKPVLGELSGTVLTVFWAFLGLESAVMVATLVDNPERNLPRATLGGVALAGIIYIAACAAIMGLVPLGPLGKSTAPFELATTAMFGAATGTLVALCAAFKASGTLGGWVLITGRTLPGLKGTSSHNPNKVMLASGIPMSIAVAATSSPTLAGQFTLLTNVAVVLNMLFYIVACVLLIRVDRRPISLGMASVGIGFAAWIVSLSGKTLLEWTAAITIGAIAIYLILNRMPRARSATVQA
jgi:arginine:agmatine antiporter